MKYRGQLGQDEFIDKLYRQMKGGVYLDCGAHNGLDYSNTYFLEHERNWTGILVEPMAEAFQQLQLNRSDTKNKMFNCALSNYEGEGSFTQIKDCDDLDMLSCLTDEMGLEHHTRMKKDIINKTQNYEPYDAGYIVKIKVPVRTITSICDETGTYKFDFCSLDTEGSEFSVLKGIDFDKIYISIFIVENNGYEQNIGIEPFLSEKGYIKYGSLTWDDVYIKKELLNG